MRGAERKKVPMVVIPEAEDDAFGKFSEARWRYPPMSEPALEWWKHVKVKYDMVIPEFGAKIRGMINRVPRLTWEGAHNRRYSWELKHWSSLNAYAHKNEKKTSIDV